MELVEESNLSLNRFPAAVVSGADNTLLEFRIACFEPPIAYPVHYYC